MTIGDNIKMLAKKKGLSLTALCKNVKINKGQMSKYTTGKRGMSLDTFIRIAKCYPGYVWEFDEIRFKSRKGARK